MEKTTYQTMPTLQAVFEGAKAFGLSDREVWQTVNGVMYESGPEATVSEYLAELTGALARTILHKERRR